MDDRDVGVGGTSGGRESVVAVDDPRASDIDRGRTEPSVGVHKANHEVSTEWGIRSRMHWAPVATVADRRVGLTSRYRSLTRIATFVNY